MLRQCTMTGERRDVSNRQVSNRQNAGAARSSGCSLGEGRPVAEKLGHDVNVAGKAASPMLPERETMRQPW
jgi:hypothetical protein